MRKLFIAMIAGGFLLLSGVVASARFDSGSASQAPQIQADGLTGNGAQGNQTGNTNSQTTDKAATKPATKPATPATKPTTAAPKPAATTAECGETSDINGEHENEDLNCNDQQEQAGVNESKTANNAEKGGNSED